jgi:hypothetical protein
MTPALVASGELRHWPTLRAACFLSPGKGCLPPKRKRSAGLAGDLPIRGSASDGRLEVGRVAIPLHLDRGERLLDRGQVLRRQRDRGGGEILLEPV